MKTYDIPAECLQGYNVGIHPHHAQLLHNVLMAIRPDRYLEIGCGYGVSTSAAVAAGVAVVAVDPKPRLPDALFDAVTVHRMTSLAYLRDCLAPDVVFVDGDHTPENVAAEIAELRRLDVATVIAHDTRNRWQPGPKQFIGAYPDYESINDTFDRGLFMASRVHQVMEQIRWAYSEWKEWLCIHSS